jgi:peptide/nickel transport system permease protein
MIRYAGVRLAQGVVALFFVVSVVFVLGRLSGDSAALLAPADATPEQIAEVRQSLGLDRSIFVQYIEYFRNLVLGDFGESTSFRVSVSELVMPAMFNTAKLALVGFAIALVVGIALGTVAAFRAHTPYDLGVRVVSVLGQSVPSFWLGMLLVLLFSVTLGWLPAFGDVGLQSYILPALALAALPMAAIARITRSAVLEILNRDQTLFQRTKGGSTRVLVIHVLRNASLPVVTLAGIQLGVMFSGTIVVENLFAWPGVGQLAIQAIQARDFALIQGIVLVNTIVFIVLLFLVDLSYGVLDPRVRSTSRTKTPVQVVAADNREEVRA